MSLTANRRVVITGMGLVTPLGLSVKENWTNLLAGKSSVKKLFGNGKKK
jgi:3-oxoacyl-[acyl-carrier-protein] synthase II